MTSETVLGGAGGPEAVLDHGGEDIPVEWLEVHLVHHAHGQRGVLLHAEVAGEGGQAHQPQGDEVAAVEGEVEEAGQVDQESVGEVLSLVDDNHRRGTTLFHHVHESLLDVGPELCPPV